jgi:putative transposase|tara:strand:- start:1806 stop:2015 length:210 start_codon:yes stop_codon:yes gene_type:complete
MNSHSPDYHGCRFPPENISHAVWRYHRFCMSFRDVEDLLAQCGITVSYAAHRTVRPSSVAQHALVPCLG